MAGYNVLMVSPCFPMNKIPARMERAGIRADVRIFNAAVNACAQAPWDAKIPSSWEMFIGMYLDSVGCEIWDAIL